jgi:hypothetical protein
MTDALLSPRQHIEDGIDRMVTAAGVTTVIRNVHDGKRYMLGMRGVGGTWRMRIVPVRLFGLPRRGTILWEGATPTTPTPRACTLRWSRRSRRKHRVSGRLHSRA